MVNPSDSHTLFVYGVPASSFSKLVLLSMAAKEGIEKINSNKEYAIRFIGISFYGF
jgi:hypothetical protein